MPYFFLPERKKDFHICPSCFSLTDLTKQSSQRCKCEPETDFYSWDPGCNFLLCVGCARVVTGGESRYSWLACTNCKLLNPFIQNVFHGSLPFCRHSIGNGLGVSMTLIGEALEKRTGQVIASLDLQKQLKTWRDLMARQLFELVPQWQDRHYIHTAEWEHQFPSSLLASAISLQGFFGTPDFLVNSGIQAELNLELMQRAQKKGLVTRKGNWYHYQGLKWQGHSNEEKFCAGNDDIKNELLIACYDSHVLNQMRDFRLSFWSI